MPSNGKSLSTNQEDQRERSSADTRLSSSKNILNILPNVEVRPMNGRVIGTRSPRIPPMVKAIIGEAAAMGGSNKVVAETFDVHRNSVSKAKEEHSEAKKELDKEIHEKAIDAIAGMFETCVAPEQLAKLEAKDATRAMKDLAKVAEAFGEKKGNVFNGPTIIVFAPSAHSEDDYDVIDVDAKRID